MRESPLPGWHWLDMNGMAPRRALQRSVVASRRLVSRILVRLISSTILPLEYHYAKLRDACQVLRQGAIANPT